MVLRFPAPTAISTVLSRRVWSMAGCAAGSGRSYFDCGAPEHQGSIADAIRPCARNRERNLNVARAKQPDSDVQEYLLVLNFQPTLIKSNRLSPSTFCPDDVRSQHPNHCCAGYLTHRLAAMARVAPYFLRLIPCSVAKKSS